MKNMKRETIVEKVGLLSSWLGAIQQDKLQEFSNSNLQHDYHINDMSHSQGKISNFRNNSLS